MSSIVNHCLQISNLAFRSYIEKRVPFMAESYKHWVGYAYPCSTQLNEEVNQTIIKEDQWLVDKLQLRWDKFSPTIDLKIFLPCNKIFQQSI